MEFIPPALEFAITDSYKQRKLRKRDGIAYASNGEEKPSVVMQGGLLEVYKAAKEYESLNPTHEVILLEGSCTSLTVPIFEDKNIKHAIPNNP